MLMRHFYHCSRDANLADQPLNPFDGQTSEIRGLCFSDGEEQHFGPHSYQISLPDDCDFLTANLVWNMKLAVEEGTRAVGRNGEQLQLTLTMAEQACKEAMAEMGYDLDDETVEFVFAAPLSSTIAMRASAVTITTVATPGMSRSTAGACKAFGPWWRTSWAWWGPPSMMKTASATSAPTRTWC